MEDYSGAPGVIAVAKFNEGLTHWKIYYGYDAKGGKVAASSGELSSKAWDKDLSIKKLKEVLKYLPAGEYMIQFKAKPDSITNIISHLFELAHSESNVPGIGSGGIPEGYLPQSVYERMLKEQREKMTLEFQYNAVLQRVDGMEKDLREARKGSGSEMLKDAIGAAMNFFLAANNKSINPGGVRAGISGTNEPPVPGEDEDEETEADEREVLNNIYKTVLKEMAEREGGQRNLVILLACLNEFIKERPEQYAMIRPTILSQQEKLHEVYGFNPN